MKFKLNWMLILFIITQIFGIFVISFQPVERVDSSGVFYIPLGIILGTIFVLLLIKFKLQNIWKVWFFLANFIGIVLTLEIFIGIFSIPISLILVYLKTFKTNNYIHNISEILVYPGIVLLILPFISVNGAIVLLLLLSVYDMYSVWKSKHMIKIAKFQKQVGFSGLKIKEKKSERILGGGDVAFPMLFSSAVFLQAGWTVALFCVFGSVIGLTILFFIGKKGKFYPALPFLTLGLLLGYLSVLF